MQVLVAGFYCTLIIINRQRKVPDVIFSSTEPPAETPIVGRGCLLQAR